jgi:protein-disulfide isomerase
MTALRSSILRSVLVPVLLCSASVPAAFAASAARPPAKKAKDAASPAIPGQLEPGAPVAIIDGQPVPYSEIAASIAQELGRAEAEYQKQVYELRRGALDQLVVNRLLEAEAKKAGKTMMEWWEQDFMASLPEPTEQALRKAYEDAKDQLQGASFDQARDGLREALRRREGQGRFALLVRELSEKHGVRTLLAAPEPFRVAMEARGPSRGKEAAPVTIVEFADFQCPFCTRARETLDQVLKVYDGKVRVVYRHFPLPFHPLAEKAAEASLCAADQGKFWELHDRLFSSGAKLEVADLKAAARELGVDGVKFDGCLDAGGKRVAVEDDLRAGKAAGVQGTPALFVNGVFLNGAVPFHELKAVIDRELERGDRG